MSPDAGQMVYAATQLIFPVDNGVECHNIQRIVLDSLRRLYRAEDQSDERSDLRRNRLIAQHDLFNKTNF